MDIYIGNLAWKTKRSELQELFENFGEVTKAFIVRDRKTRRSKGFGFVEMADKDAALAAIEALNNTEFLERTIIVNEAKPKTDQSAEEDSGDEGNDANPVDSKAKDDEALAEADESSDDADDGKG